MPRVSIYQGGQVQSAGTTGERFRAADFSANIGQGIQAAGASMAQLAEARTQITERTAEDEARILDVEHMQQATTLRRQVYAARGMGATQAATTASEQLGQFNGTLLGRATTPLARKLLQRSIQTRTLQESSTWDDYATGQARDAGDTAVAARATSFRDTAADFPLGSPEAASNLAAGENEIAELGRRQGADAATTTQRVQAYRSNYHSTRVSQLFQSDHIEDAQAYLDTNRGEMTAADEESARAMLRPELMANEQAADSAMIVHGAAPTTTAPRAGGASNDNTDVPPDQAAAAMGAWNGHGNPPPPPGEPRWQLPLRTHSTTVPGGRFGAPRGYGGHAGHDYADPAGTPVYPMAEGVAHVTHSSGGGNTVEIDYGGGYRSRYLHLADGSVTVREGQRVGPNDIVAAIGNTGTASHGNHLHAELITPHGRVDPSTMVGENAPSLPAADGRRVDLAEMYRRIEAQPWTESRKRRAREGVQQWVGQNDTVRSRVEDDARRAINSALDGIAQGGGRLTSLTQLPADALRNAPPGMISDLQATIRAAQNASPAANSPLANQLIVMAADDPNGFLRLNPETYRGRLSNEEVQWITRTQVEINHRTGPQPNEILSVIRAVVPNNSPLTMAGVSSPRGATVAERNRANTQAEAEARQNLEARLLPAVQQRLRTLGHAVVTQQDIMNAVQAETLMVHGADGSLAPIFLQRDRGATHFRVPIPPRAVAMIDEALRRGGQLVTDNNRAQLYIAHRAEIDAATR